MKHLSICFVLSIILLSDVANATKKRDFGLNIFWNKFKRDYHKKYSSHDEEHRRREIFRKNLKRIQEHNAKFAKGESTYRMIINKFADLDANEVPKGLKRW
ncbi:hypothetical protein WA026_023251 [Henosepilachna vigintioctopunctata]|uniref:Cathepsin propeptide inhibitor domain-containing protein n=1 Tax=Henosepilachna vigintioctopunctata TaxID=420089 RepID=A0AAW1V329_9CUCU